MKYLLAVDGSEWSEHACQYLLGILRAGQDEVHVLSVLHTSKFSFSLGGSEAVPAVISEEEQIASATVSRCQERVVAAGCSATGDVVKGHAQTAICEAAEQYAVDVVVVGARGLGVLKRLVLGSVSSHVLSYCKASVLVVKSAPHPDSKPRRILFGCDNSQPAKAALAALLRLADPGDRVNLVHSFQNLMLAGAGFARFQGAHDAVIAELNDIEAAAQKAYLVEAEKICREHKLDAVSSFSFGDPREVLLQAAEIATYDLTVVGSRTLSDLQWWFVGSVSTGVVRDIAAPAVLVVKTAQP
eukprot:m.239535 g.239535  ORF g.239535 m.239535 type:complete len:300 (+) comp13495_c0_seq1:43-942(+)